MTQENKPHTRICYWCEPNHIIGKDYGAPYSHGMCAEASKKLNAEIDATIKKESQTNEKT